MLCKQCQMENIEGALFCEECGAQLENVSGAKDAARETAGAGRPWCSRPPTAANWRSRPRTKWSSQGGSISEMFPDVDLTGLGGMEHGVSRKHAVIHRSGAACTSRTWAPQRTYVNRKRIQPMCRRPSSPATRCASASWRSRSRRRTADKETG